MTVCQLGCGGVRQSLESYAEQFSAPFLSTRPPLCVRYMQRNDNVFLNPFYFVANIRRTHQLSKILCLMCLHQTGCQISWLNGFLINQLVPFGLMLASSISLHISRQMDFKSEISHIHGLPTSNPKHFSFLAIRTP